MYNSLVFVVFGIRFEVDFENKHDIFIILGNKRKEQVLVTFEHT